MKPQPIRATASAAQLPFEQPVWCEDLISIADLGPSGVRTVLDLTALLKTRPVDFRGALAGKQIALFFEKPSLRTRMTFEAGVHSLGGTSYFYDQTHSRLGAREKLSDIAHNLERWIDGVVLRTFEHATITELAQHAKIPVVNALSDLEHPCQALADYFTLQERFADLKAVKLAYVGDGNNVAHSLMLAAACTGGTISVATPAGYEPLPEIVDAARELAASTGAVIQTTTDPDAALDAADAVYTDVWASMGQESQSDQRAAIFAPYQVNRRLFSRAAKHAVFMHCLPAHRGSEVTDSVIDSSRSVVFDQAENRLHAQKAVLLILLGGGVTRFSPRRDGNA
ncbi:MAG: ornithine carbamoyltransferase [Acidobacteriota bacterium]|nr:ornithine carbamoyltransferase [Acidobacteriota bacterium]